MSDEKVMENLRKEVNNLKKGKIILQAKLKQKEDKLTELTKKVNNLAISSKESGSSKELEDKVKQLEEEYLRSRKVNKSLRAENSSLSSQLTELKKEFASGASSSSAPGLQKVSLSGEVPSDIDSEELEYLKQLLNKKDNIISQLTEQLDQLDPSVINQGGSYMKIRKLNAKIRELKGQMERAKKSESSMKEQMMQMQRQMTMREENLNW